MKPFSLLLLCTLAIVSACSNHKKTNQLTLIKAYEVETHNSIEPSGLTLWDGQFYTVSDKHNVIYRLAFKDNTVELEPFVHIHNNKNSKLDFEGITHDGEFFYLISETHFQILKISKNGNNQTWLPINNSLKAKGQNAGLFETHNAYFEGICIVDDNQFLLAAERQPRGFIEYDANTNQIKAYQMNQAVFGYQDHRPPDFTGLSCNDEGLYVLDRNAYVVAQLKRKQGQYTEINGYSYKHIVNQQQFRYEDMQYGHAEGLVVDGDDVYLILDNNRNPQQNGRGNNSLFLHLKK
ncbi:MAG: esterase-like activity of phytase family protein [Proteobacteria bacterium]|nr:esterase-like activity of phytase family protein [Pseudomonadota bacterium]